MNLKRLLTKTVGLASLINLLINSQKTKVKQRYAFETSIDLPRLHSCAGNTVTARRQKYKLKGSQLPLNFQLVSPTSHDSHLPKFTQPTVPLTADGYCVDTD